MVLQFKFVPRGTLILFTLIFSLVLSTYCLEFQT